ncbi:ABC transporter type 1, transmembrane domain-containing protein [Suillus lakei]|nr:ABC transporter type 1, transmembrane domain-containing protein [Suillus lakei]
MSMLSSNHVLTLSLSCHTKRKTGELLCIFDRGSAVNRIGELIKFMMIPVLVDEGVAFVVFVVRTGMQRQMSERDVVTRGFHTDCLLNYEAVKYFSGEEYKAQRYAEAIGEYQSSGSSVALSLSILNLVQTLIITFGLVVGSLIVASRITRGQTNTSDFVFISYYALFYFPLSNLGGVYHAINQSLIDTDKMLHFFNEPTEVVDEPDAKELVVSNGEVEFATPLTMYPSPTTIKLPPSTTFKVSRGGRVALVSESGAGKAQSCASSTGSTTSNPVPDAS